MLAGNIEPRKLNNKLLHFFDAIGLFFLLMHSIILPQAEQRYTTNTNASDFR